MDETDQKISQSLGELILLDVFTRYGVSKEMRRNLSEEQKEQIRKIVEDLKEQTEGFLKSAKTTTTVAGDTATEDTSSISKPDSARKRLGFRK